MDRVTAHSRDQWSRKIDEYRRLDNNILKPAEMKKPIASFDSPVGTMVSPSTIAPLLAIETRVAPVVPDKAAVGKFARL